MNFGFLFKKFSKRLLKPKLVSNFATIGLPKFQNFKLREETILALESLDIQTPSPIQELAIPKLLSSPQKNYFIAAQTGTGKTFTYLIPMLENLKKIEDKERNSMAFNQNDFRITISNRPSALIIVSSKELVEQVTKVIKSLSHFIKFKVDGFSSFTKYNEEKALLDDGIDILVSTPNRIERHSKDKNLYLSNLKYFIVDEADTLIEAGFSEEISKLCKIFKTSEKTSMIFVSATMSVSLSKFFDSTFGKAHNFNKIIEKNTHYNLTNVNHEFIHVLKLDKYEPLQRLIREIWQKIIKSNGSLMIFCNSIPSCQSLEYKLKEWGYDSVCLHGDIPLKLRNQNFNRFTGRNVNILISTDLGSRGLDFPFLSHVINFDFPKTSTDYLHRAGRTGRAGTKGDVISFYHNKDQKILNELKESHENQKPLKLEQSSFGYESI